MYWPQERWRQAVGVIPRLTVLYGGPHSSFEVEYGAQVILPLAPRGVPLAPRGEALAPRGEPVGRPGTGRRSRLFG